MPIKAFETSDIAVKDVSVERQSRNIRHAAAIWCNRTAGFEVVHGLLDRTMQILEIPYINHAKANDTLGYYIESSQGCVDVLII